MTSERYQIPDKLASELASVVIEWGKFEMALVTDTSIMMAYPIVQKLADEAPRSFKKKIELWKRCVDALYPTVTLYRHWASEICKNGKVVSRQRNRLIHGIWDISESKSPGLFRVTTFKALHYVEQHEDKGFGVDYVEALRDDIRTLSDALYSLTINRMLHGALGLLQAVREPKS